MPRNIRVDEANRRLYFEVVEEDLAIAIGRRGQNARLTSRLLGWKLDISKEQKEDIGYDARKEAAVEAWHGVPGVSAESAQRLVELGVVNPEAFVGVEIADLIDGGFEAVEAEGLISSVNGYRSAHKIGQ